jgi:hypothetical protein
MTMYKEADNNNLDNNNGGFQPILEDEELRQHGGVPMEIDVPALSAISNHEANTEERRPRIQFNEDGNHVVTIEPFYEFSDEEHSALWYTEEETCLFEAESKKTIKAYKKSVFGLEELDASEFCLRGLEDRVSTRDYMVRRGLQMEYTRGVLLEQERQRKMGVQEPFGMHEHMGVSSKWAVSRAIELGAADAQDAASDNAQNLVPQKLLRPDDRISSTANARRMDSLQLIRRHEQQKHMMHQFRNAQWGLSSSTSPAPPTRASMPSVGRTGSNGSGMTNATWGDPSQQQKRKSSLDKFALMA